MITIRNQIPRLNTSAEPGRDKKKGSGKQLDWSLEAGHAVLRHRTSWSTLRYRTQPATTTQQLHLLGLDFKKLNYFLPSTFSPSFLYLIVSILLGDVSGSLGALGARTNDRSLISQPTRPTFSTFRFPGCTLVVALCSSQGISRFVFLALGSIVKRTCGRVSPPQPEDKFFPFVFPDIPIMAASLCHTAS